MIRLRVKNILWMRRIKHRHYPFRLMKLIAQVYTPRRKCLRPTKRKLR